MLSKAELDLSSLSCVCMCVDLFKTPPLEMAFLLGIPLSLDLDSPQKN